MNSLSWMIYLADVAGVANVFFGLGGIVFGIVMFVCGFVATAAQADCGDETAAPIWRATKWAASLCLVLSVMAVAIPSRETIYAIAASEMGEKALNTETGGKAVKALNAWLDRQITEGE